MQTFVKYTLFCMSWFTHSIISLSSKFPLKQLIVLLVRKYMYTYFLCYGLLIQLSFLSFGRKIKKQVHFHLAAQYYSTFQQNFLIDHSEYCILYYYISAHRFELLNIQCEKRLYFKFRLITSYPCIFCCCHDKD